RSFPVLAFHAGLGIVLFLAGLAVAYMLAGFGPRSWFVGSIVGLGAVVIAGIGGAGYLDNHYPPFDAFVMAAAFLAAFWAYFWIRVDSSLPAEP
ncbi:MAG: hypothetical protein ACREC5_04890, partial [Thermoplasmata archaeon]